MRLTIFAAALVLGSAALAQSSDPGQAPMGAPNGSPPPADQSMPSQAPAGDQSMPSTPPADQSMPANPPSGSTMPAAPDQSMAPASGGMSTMPQASTMDYPACSATVKDKCVDKGGAGHMAMTHHMTHHVMHHPRHVMKKTMTTTTTTAAPQQ